MARKKPRGPRTSGWKKNDPHQAYQMATRGAKRKGVDFTLTEEEFFTLYLRPCVYCAHEFLRSYGHGLDQRVPGAGYTRVNALPCCWECNRVKGNKYTFLEMRRIGKTLSSIKRKREG